MSKLITYIPLSSVERIELRVTNCRKTLSQVKAETKAHYVLNGGMWNPDGSACPLLKVGGVMRSGTPWRAMGYAWDKGPDIHMTSEYGGADNFIAVTALISSGEPVDKPSYGSAQGGKRGAAPLACGVAVWPSIALAMGPETQPRRKLCGTSWPGWAGPPPSCWMGAAPVSVTLAESASPPAARCTTGFACISSRAVLRRRRKRRTSLCASTLYASTPDTGRATSTDPRTAPTKSGSLRGIWHSVSSRCWRPRGWAWCSPRRRTTTPA